MKKEPIVEKKEPIVELTLLFLLGFFTCLMFSIITLETKQANSITHTEIKSDHVKWIITLNGKQENH